MYVFQLLSPRHDQVTGKLSPPLRLVSSGADQVIASSRDVWLQAGMRSIHALAMLEVVDGV
jgi:hypothetical protein